MVKKIVATTQYNDFEGGFWGLISDTEYLPINYPEQLKTSGIKTECILEIITDMDSAYNWGQLCRLISFRTLNPYGQK